MSTELSTHFFEYMRLCDEALFPLIKNLTYHNCGKDIPAPRKSLFEEAIENLRNTTADTDTEVTLHGLWFATEMDNLFETLLTIDNTARYALMIRYLSCNPIYVYIKNAGNYWMAFGWENEVEFTEFTQQNGINLDYLSWHVFQPVSYISDRLCEMIADFDIPSDKIKKRLDIDISLFQITNKSIFVKTLKDDYFLNGENHRPLKTAGRDLTIRERIQLFLYLLERAGIKADVMSGDINKGHIARLTDIIMGWNLEEKIDRSRAYEQIKQVTSAKQNEQATNAKGAQKICRLLQRIGLNDLAYEFENGIR